MKKITKCQLCGSQEPLQDSHIIPHFLYKYMSRHLKSEFDGDKPIQFDSKLNLIQRSDRQWKEKMFCWDCEQLLSKNEKLFSEIFKDIASCHKNNRIKFAYRYGMELEQLDKELGFSKQDIKLLLDNSYLNIERANIIRYFAISYIIRFIYLSNVKVSEHLLRHIEGILYGLPLDSVKVIMTVNTGNDFKMISSVYPLDDDPRFKHFLFVMPEIKIHLIIDEKLEFEGSKVLVLPDDLFKDTDLIKLFSSTVKGMRVAENAKDIIKTKS